MRPYRSMESYFSANNHRWQPMSATRTATSPSWSATPARSRISMITTRSVSRRIPTRWMRIRSATAASITTARQRPITSVRGTMIPISAALPSRTPTGTRRTAFTAIIPKRSTSARISSGWNRIPMPRRSPQSCRAEICMCVGLVIRLCMLIQVVVKVRWGLTASIAA